LSSEPKVKVGVPIEELGLDNIEDITKQNLKKNKSSGVGVLHTTKVKSSSDFINATQDIVIEEQRRNDIEVSRADLDFPYVKVPLLTNAEMQLYHFMLNNLCQLDKISIFTKVRLGDLVQLDNRLTTDMKYFWKVSSKHVDFLICNKDTLDVICAVELDDYTHETQEAKDRDIFVMQTLETVGIKTVRIRIKISTIEKRDIYMIDEYINRALAPKCPYCGKQMYPKESRTGHRFYACEDFINCRRTINIDPMGEG
jgi:hypothetical protein